MTTTDWAVGSTLTRGSKAYRIQRITPPGAAGTSQRQGPTFHAILLGADGNPIPRGLVIDIWAGSAVHPPALYTKVVPR